MYVLVQASFFIGLNAKILNMLMPYLLQMFSLGHQNNCSCSQLLSFSFHGENVDLPLLERNNWLSFSVYKCIYNVFSMSGTILSSLQDLMHLVFITLWSR